MLIDFTVGNFLSFKDKVTLSMIGSSITGHECNYVDKGKFKLLKSAAIYGANASGKSNLIEAMRFFRNTIINSANFDSTENIAPLPFLLDTNPFNQPSFFEIRFFIEDVICRYGFEIDRKGIASEWLFRKNEKVKESGLFTRERQNFKISKSFKEGQELDKKKLVKKNSLLVSISDRFNGPVSQKIMSWIKLNFQSIVGLDDETYLPFTMKQLQNEKWKSKIITLLQKFDLGFEDVLPVKNVVEVQDNDPKSNQDQLFPTKSKKEFQDIVTIHKTTNTENEESPIAFPLDIESEGTKKLIALSGPLVDTFHRGVTLVIDEFDARMHPLISKKIIELFHDPQINKKNAQLIFATHDTNLLTNKLFRRDQIWFTEKNLEQSTDLYSLVEINLGNGYNKKAVRKDASYEKDYILGKYGAIPFIGSINNLEFDNE